MANITAKDVSELREITGAGILDCKKALVATDGDKEKAIVHLREMGVAVAAKKAGRIASEGAVAGLISKEATTGALVEVNCESDFVGKSDEFKALCANIATHILSSNAKDVDSLLVEKYIGDKNISIQDLINNSTAKTGEKLSLRRFTKHALKCGRQEIYIHMGGKIGVMLEVETDKDLNTNADFVTMCHDVAMQVAAASPKYVYETEIPESERESEKNILKTQALKEGKPADVVDKMIVGRLKKYFKEICLVDQEFFKDTSLSIGQLVDNCAKSLGAKIKIIKFERLVMGEGLEKKVDNLAEEVAKMAQK